MLRWLTTLFPWVDDMSLFCFIALDLVPSVVEGLVPPVTRIFIASEVYYSLTGLLLVELEATLLCKFLTSIYVEPYI
jgi:hypothetical protein